MKILSRKKTFTIIEVLVAIFILEVGILAVGSFFASSFNITRNARTETIAANLGSGLLDETLANSFDNIQIVSGKREKYSLDQNDPFYNYEKQVDVTYIDASLNNSTAPTAMKKISVTIYWTVGTKQKTFQIVSIKTSH